MLKLWQVSFTYREHEMETDVFVHTDSPRPTTADARQMLMSQFTDNTDSGYMQDAIEDPSLLVIDGVRAFNTAYDIEGNPYKIEVSA